MICCEYTISENEKLPESNITEIYIVLIQISYDIIWEADRIQPKNAYLELLDHPENTIPWTLNDEIDNNSNIENGNSVNIYLGNKGIISHIDKVHKKVNIGAKKNIIKLEFDVYNNSLINNFKPSENGCKKPNNPTILGPRLRWILLITFLSSNVKKAIVSNINTINNTNDNI